MARNLRFGTCLLFFISAILGSAPGSAGVQLTSSPFNTFAEGASQSFRLQFSINDVSFFDLNIPPALFPSLTVADVLEVTHLDIQVQWGDGLSTFVTMGAGDSVAPSSVVLLGTHTYADAGTYMAVATADAQLQFRGPYASFSSLVPDWQSELRWTDNLQVVIAPVVAPIPEPETYAMLLAGLALLGFETRRRRKLQRAAA